MRYQTHHQADVRSLPTKTLHDHMIVWKSERRSQPEVRRVGGRMHAAIDDWICKSLRTAQAIASAMGERKSRRSIVMQPPYYPWCG